MMPEIKKGTLQFLISIRNPVADSFSLTKMALVICFLLLFVFGSQALESNCLFCFQEEGGLSLPDK